MVSVIAERANFSGTYFNIDNYFDGSDFRNTNWDGANIRGSWFRACDFTGASFSGTGARETIFQGSNFQNANINTANFRGANFREANLAGARISNCNTADQSFNEAKFKYAYLASSVWNNVTICGAVDWENAIFTDTDPETGGTIYTTLLNVSGPDCYLYYANAKVEPDPDEL